MLKKPSVRSKLFLADGDGPDGEPPGQPGGYPSGQPSKMAPMELPPSLLVAPHPAFSDFSRWVFRSALARGIDHKFPCPYGAALCAIITIHYELHALSSPPAQPPLPSASAQSPQPPVPAVTLPTQLPTSAPGQ